MSIYYQLQLEQNGLTKEQLDAMITDEVDFTPSVTMTAEQLAVYMSEDK